jgi:hypothetical protein
VTITVADSGGNVVRRIQGAGAAGVNRVASEAARGGRGVPAAAPTPPGEYVVTLEVGNQKFVQKTQVLPFTVQPFK